MAKVGFLRTGEIAEAMVRGLAGFLAETPKDGAGRLDTALASFDTEGGLNQTLREQMRAACADTALLADLDGFRVRLGLPPRD